MQIKTNGKSGFTLVEIMIVVAIIGLLAAIAIPNFVRAREVSQLNAIYNNLRVIEGAKDQWALETKQTTGATVAQTDVTPYFQNARFPAVVVGETYVINAVGTAAQATLPGTLAGKSGTISVP